MQVNWRTNRNTVAAFSPALAQTVDERFLRSPSSRPSWSAPAERSGDGAFERAIMIEQSTRLVRAKAVSRCACHRSSRRASPSGAVTNRFLVAALGRKPDSLKSHTMRHRKLLEYLLDAESEAEVLDIFKLRGLLQDPIPNVHIRLLSVKEPKSYNETMPAWTPERRVMGKLATLFGKIFSLWRMRPFSREESWPAR